MHPATETRAPANTGARSPVPVQRAPVAGRRPARPPPTDPRWPHQTAPAAPAAAPAGSAAATARSAAAIRRSGCDGAAWASAAASAARRTRSDAARCGARGGSATAATTRRAPPVRPVAATPGSRVLRGVARAEQSPQRQVQRLVEHVLGVADAARVQAGVEGAARLSESREEVCAHRRAIAEQFLTGFRIVETVAALEWEVPLLGGQDAHREDLAPRRRKPR